MPKVFRYVLFLVSSLFLMISSFFVFPNYNFYVTSILNNSISNPKEAVVGLLDNLSETDSQQISDELYEATKDNFSINPYAMEKIDLNETTIISATHNYRNEKNYINLGIYSVGSTSFKDLYEQNTIFVSVNKAKSILGIEQNAVFDYNLAKNVVDKTVCVETINGTVNFIIKGVFGYPDDKIYNSFKLTFGEFYIMSDTNFNANFVSNNFSIKILGDHKTINKGISILEKHNVLDNLKFVPNNSEYIRLNESCNFYKNNVSDFSFVKFSFLILFIISTVALFFSSIVITTSLLDYVSSKNIFLAKKNHILFIYFVVCILTPTLFTPVIVSNIVSPLFINDIAIFCFSPIYFLICTTCCLLALTKVIICYKNEIKYILTLDGDYYEENI